MKAILGTFAALIRKILNRNMNLDWRCIFGSVSEWVIIAMQCTCLNTMYLLHCVAGKGHEHLFAHACTVNAIVL